MTEHDSGSSSDSSSESTSSSGSDSSGGSGPDLSPLVQHILDDVLEPRPHSSPIGPPLPPVAERERRAQYEKALKEILFSKEPIPDRTSLIRKIVEGERWFLPTAPDGGVERLPGSDPRVQRALARPLAYGLPARRSGRGSRPPAELVLALAADPGRPARQLTGRELAGVIPPDAAGAIFFLDADDAVALRREELPLLAQLADSLDLEEILANPGPGQVEALQRARWYVPADNPKLRPSPPGSGYPTIYIYTHPDRSTDAKSHPMVQQDGLTLFRLLANRSNYVEICVNPMAPIGVGEGAMLGVSLAPNFAPGIARGVDPRSGAAPLPARTLAEALLWLDLEGFPWKDREIVAVPRPDGSPADGPTLIQVRTTHTNDWRLVGKSYQSKPPPGPTMSPVFALASADQLPACLPAPVPPAYVNLWTRDLNRYVPMLTPEQFDLGEGQTQILCAGLLADYLYSQDHWSPTGWFVSKQERWRAVMLAGRAHELLKLIPPGKDRLPRSSIRSVAGAQHLQMRSWIADRAWIEKQHRRHAAFVGRRANFWPFVRS